MKASNANLSSVDESFEIPFKSMMDLSPINTMLSTPDGTILYINKKSKETLKSLEHLMPIKVDQMLGQKIDIFHQKPEVQRGIISKASNLPHRAIITLGPEKLDLLVSPCLDEKGQFVGAMVTWDVVTTKVELVEELNKSSQNLFEYSGSLITLSNSMSASAEQTASQANTVSSASEQVNIGVQTVATNMEEMSAAIKEITKTTNATSEMSSEALKLAHSANEIIGKLGESSQDIGDVIKVISSIAQQTNLLALNATIEAARAGEAGKGFAVVANEVKELAKQTASSTQDITKKIEGIQKDTINAIQSLSDIGEAIDKINAHTSNIAASVEEQSAATNEVTRIVSDSASGVNQISENIAQVSVAANVTGKDAQKSFESAKNLKEIAEVLKEFVSKLEV